MHAVDIIQKKRDGQALSDEEIRWFIEAYTAGDIPDYQAAALTMAIFFNSMTRDETVTLTQVMAESGDMLDLSSVAPYIVDKHSSGGVGDKTSLIVLPMVATCGVPVAKMSGRGLGHTGGTLDKLESIAGYNINLTEDEFMRLAHDEQLVLAGQTRELAPADGKLYSLRDVTATVDSLPLIASSIMSKKLASGANGIVLDVKVGVGAFMETLAEARDLARMMAQIGHDAGRDVVAVLSDMNQPLGRAVGNSLEVIEAIETMQGNGPEDVVEHCVEIALHMLRLAGQGDKWTDDDDTRALLHETLNNGDALEQFRRLIANQGGDVSVIDDPSKLPRASIQENLVAGDSGYVKGIAANKVGQAALVLGAGRETKGMPVDHAVGVEVFVRVGDPVEAGDIVATLHANDPEKAEEAKVLLTHAITYSNAEVERLPLFYGVLDSRRDLA